MDIAKYAHTKPKEMRDIIRNGGWDHPTSGLCLGHVQGNMIVLPKDWAYDFLVFAQHSNIKVVCLLKLQHLSLILYFLFAMRFLHQFVKIQE